MSALDDAMSPLNQLEWACEESDKVGEELLEIKRYLDLLGLDVGSLYRALDAISMTRVRILAAHRILSETALEDRSRRCA